jgi:hypothetical protein
MLAVALALVVMLIARPGRSTARPGRSTAAVAGRPAATGRTPAHPAQLRDRCPGRNHRPLRSSSFGDFAPKLVSLTDIELKEIIDHLAFDAGWPRAMSAIGVAKQVSTVDAAARTPGSTEQGGDEGGDPDQEAEHEGPGGDVHR